MPKSTNDIYSQLPRPSLRQIRILHLHEGSFEDALAADLVVESLDSAPVYKNAPAHRSLQKRRLDSSHCGTSQQCFGTRGMHYSAQK